ncbi:peptidase [Sporothrix brasiliensis 5110]|uniref:Peptidase n=1 Tax=Sporothrix brasiliensis 5110 TaxID=1398154 RepID=A0A0C2JA14_9PEZI|nr:peptidase [Sporothrix brasiliensis 5110]KIH93762.1 peptidase [Sporothrix brasiliensis 5110]
MPAPDQKALLLQALDAAADAHIRLLQTFVQTPSPNPPGDTRAAAAVLTAFLDNHGVPYEIVTPSRDNGANDEVRYPNIVSDFAGGAGPGPRLVLNGHIDVFPVDPASRGQWTHDPWSGAIEGDRIHGRGVVDMKLGTAALLVAYVFLHERRHLLRGSVAFCGVSDEETGGQWGTSYLVRSNRQRWGGDVMLGAEPVGVGSVRFSEKGTLRMRCVCATAGAHGAYTNLSQGAVRTAAAFLGDVVAAVEGLDAAARLPPSIVDQLRRPDVRQRIDDIMGPGTADVIAKPTVNIGTIEGGVGSAINMIPDTCRFSLDIRMPVGLTRDDVLPVIEKATEKYKPAASFVLSVVEPASNPASVSPLGHPVLDLLIRNAHGLAPGDPAPLAIPSMGATDCKHYRYAGIPAYIYGGSPKTSK